MSLTCCWSMPERMWWDCLSQYMQCHSQPVGHRRRCDETAIHNMYNVTHLLLVQVKGKNVMRLPSQNVMSLTSCCHSDETFFAKCTMSLTPCWSWEKKWWDCPSPNVQCHSLPVGHREDVRWLPFTKCVNVTHFLLEKMWWDCHSQNVQYHSHTVGHGKRCDETALHKMCNATHSLLVIGKDLMRLFSQIMQCHSHPVDHNRKRFDETKCAMSLTPCWSWEKMWWDCLTQNVQYHSLPVGHRKDVMRLPFRKCAMLPTSWWA